jgi:hypothetical protein
MTDHQSTAPRAAPDESGWLIEHGDEPKWWSGWPGYATAGAHPPMSEPVTTDSTRAEALGALLERAILTLIASAGVSDHG